MKTPWHLWLIGLLTLLWNGGGAFDYLMVKARADWYVSQLTPDQLDYFLGFPGWVGASWAVAVWGGVVGSVLLLARSGYAVLAFFLSFLAMSATSIYGFFLSDVSMVAVMGQQAALFSLAIVGVALLVVFYARAMRRSGVLRHR